MKMGMLLTQIIIFIVVVFFLFSYSVFYIFMIQISNKKVVFKKIWYDMEIIFVGSFDKIWKLQVIYPLKLIKDYSILYKIGGMIV